jgi:uncharacterized BrkB/YihY/UPF0761 family membrane protein
VPCVPQSRQALRVCASSANVNAAADSYAQSSLDPIEKVVSKVVGVKNAQTVVTVGYIGLWYALNVAFNLQNKVRV